jgi:hypothetical protein
MFCQNLSKKIFVLKPKVIKYVMHESSPTILMCTHVSAIHVCLFVMHILFDPIIEERRTITFLAWFDNVLLFSWLEGGILVITCIILMESTKNYTTL